MSKASAGSIVVERKALLAALTAVAPAVATSGAALPTLRGVKIAGGGDGVVLSATNLDLHLDSSLEGEVIGKAGEVVINARKLRTVVSRGLPAGPITLSLDPKRPSVSAGTATVWFDALPLDAWPTRRAITDGDTITLTADDIAVIKRLAVAASPDWARPILRSVCLGDGHAVATDSYRLIAGRVSASPAHPVLLPLEVVKALPADGVELVVDHSHGEVAWPGGFARLVTGDYPNWSKLMPEPNPAPVVLDRDAFLAAVLRADAVLSTHGSEGSAPPPLLIVPAAGGVTLSARHAGEDVLRDSVELFDAGATVEPLALNARFLAECLRAIKAQRVRLSIRTSLLPVLITADSDDADGFRALLMPVRVSEDNVKAAA